jgi:hypothetical protein
MKTYTLCPSVTLAEVYLYRQPVDFRRSYPPFLVTEKWRKPQGLLT